MSEEQTDGEEYKKCPFCCEKILQNAIKCKHCGEFLDGRAKNAGAGADAASKQEKAETILWNGNPSNWNYFGYHIIGLFLIGGGGALLWFKHPWIAIPLFVVALLMLLIILIVQKTVVYSVTNKRIMAKTGFLSRQINEISMGDIRYINLNQSLSERILGVGNLSIASSGTAGIEIVFMGISAPSKVKEIISKGMQE